MLNNAQVVAELPRASSRQSAAILSSIEFDRDRAVFATAGVSKRISLFDYANVLAHPHVQQHCPAAELVTRSKLSCLSWNKCAAAPSSASQPAAASHDAP